MSSADEPALIDFMQIAGRFSRCLDNVFFTSPMSESGQTEKDRHRRMQARLTSNNGNIWRQIGTAVPCHKRSSSRPRPTGPDTALLSHRA
jgi:hypothetical protein